VEATDATCKKSPSPNLSCQGRGIIFCIRLIICVNSCEFVVNYLRGLIDSWFSFPQATNICLGRWTKVIVSNIIPQNDWLALLLLFYLIHKYWNAQTLPIPTLITAEQFWFYLLIWPKPKTSSWQTTKNQLDSNEVNEK